MTMRPSPLPVRATLLSLIALLALPAGPAGAEAAKAKSPAKAGAKPAAGEKTGEKAGEKKKETFSADTFEGLSFRAIGPALTSGRVVDLAVVPSRPSTYYVAVASGGLWKTTNGGTTFKPIFDKEASFSVGCVTLDPKNPLVVWVGSGENNSQRSVAYGDGVYKSVDGGRSFENVGLKNSEHVGKIVVDPRDGNVVYVAAQGPLWADGGDRGLYKTTDGGKSWKAALTISPKTGVSDVWFDPRDPDVLYAAAYQRRRHVWTLLNGGPESAIHKSTDAGATWKKLENGLPKGDVGRIGLAVSPAEPDTVYAIVEAAEKGGFYRSTDAGSSWEKRSDYVSGSPQYYQEIFPDPKRVDRVYSMDVFLKVTEDGGKTWRNLGEKYKHVDNHAVWIDPADTDHLLVGCDGGLYETWDRGANWDYKPNLSITQFYRVAVDEALPFYNVHGGTQDNFSLGGPSRTTNVNGIRNSDWYVTQGGDGFGPQVDPENPDIVYAQAQYGALVRFDKRSGERIDIQPQPGPGEAPLRWNWDSPLLVSPHSHTRLYFAAQRVFRSDDRGDTWRPISGDLSQQIDRNKLPVMGRVFGPDAVAKNASTSFYGNVTAFTESPKKEGLLYAGTDDGLVQVTEDGGGSWRKESAFPGVPKSTFVSELAASRHAVDTLYAAFDNHKMGDFKPYVLRSTDRGRTWTSIAGNLPERGSAYAIAEDHVKPGLLFVGTEFGVYFAVDADTNPSPTWVRLKGGLPPIPVRDIAIQRRENDLVLATFGRGFYILDDYSPLRGVSPASVEKEAELFPVRKAAAYVPARPLGGRDQSFQGASFFVAPNPPFGALFTYYLKDELKTKKKVRQDEEKKLAKDGKDTFYPSWDALRAEAREDEPTVLLTVADEEGRVVRRVKGPVKSGFHRVAWDLRYPAANPTRLSERKDDDEDDDDAREGPRGPYAAPGTYVVSLAKIVDGVATPLSEKQTFTVEPLGLATLGVKDRAALAAFQKKSARLQRAALGAVEAAKEARARIDHLEKALLETPAADPKLRVEAKALEGRLRDLQVALTGDPVVAKYNEPTSPAITDRVATIVTGQWSTTQAPTKTHEREYAIGAAELADVLGKLRTLVETDLAALEARAEAAGAPWTPGRIPTFRPE